jgi:hypothetical protein
MTNKRATMKVWNVITVCLNTKAVTMHLAPGYSTADFFIAYDSHVYDRGVPANVHSDKGSQLVAAGKEVMDVDWKLSPRDIPPVVQVGILLLLEHNGAMVQLKYL